jgi:putative addiction module component (TIGR02574 family)
VLSFYNAFGRLIAVTIDQIIAETKSWPAARVEELVGRLVQTMDGPQIDPDIDQAWKEEVRRRVAEIEEGKVEMIPGEQVSAELRKMLGR